MRHIENNEVGQRQQMILQCIWEAGGKATVPDIIDGIEKRCGVRLSSSAVNTMVLILVDKGLVEQGDKRGHAYLYHTVLTEKEFRIREMKRIRKLTFDDSSKAMLISMIEAGLKEEEMK